MNNYISKEHMFKRSLNNYLTYPIIISKEINETTVKGYFDKDKLTLTQKISLSNI